MANDEFRGEAPATAQSWLKTGEKVQEDGAYYCVNCYNAKQSEMVNLRKGDMIPVCATCTPNSRWTKV